MTYIPNVREEGPYNEKNLKGKGKSEIIGYDIAVENVKNFFDNLEEYTDSLVIHYLSEHEEEAAKVKEALLHWMELDRNEYVVSILDEDYVEEEDEKFDESGDSNS